MEIPEGFVLMPIEPTETMKVNGGLAIEDAMFGNCKTVFDAAGEAYRMMLKAHALSQTTEA